MTFLVIAVVVIRQTSKQRGKIWQLIGGPLTPGVPSHGTTGTMDNPALAVSQYSDKTRHGGKGNVIDKCELS